MAIHFNRSELNTVRARKDITLGFMKALQESNVELDSDEEALRGKTIRSEDDGDMFMIGIYAHG